MKDIKTKITIKGIMMYEELSGDSFYEIGPDDMITFMYAIIVANNPQMRLTKKEFENILENEKIAKKILNDIQEEFTYIQNLTPTKKVEEKETEQELTEMKKIKVSEIATNLIVSYGVDVNYVMNEMELWELIPFSNAVETKMKNEMSDKRFWTYLQILPHIDGKKCKGPQQLIPFPWEKNEKKVDGKQFLSDNNDRIMGLFKQNKEEDDK